MDSQYSITLTGAQIESLLQYAENISDGDIEEVSISLINATKPWKDAEFGEEQPAGLYVMDNEIPEEGVVPIDILKTL